MLLLASAVPTALDALGESIFLLFGRKNKAHQAGC